MNSTRAAVVAAVSTLLADTDALVIPHARDIDPPGVRTVMVRLDEITPLPSVPRGRSVAGTLICLSALTLSGAADDDVDAWAELVLGALDDADGIVWTVARRGLFADKHPSWGISFTLATITTQQEI